MIDDLRLLIRHRSLSELTVESSLVTRRLILSPALTNAQFDLRSCHRSVLLIGRSLQTVVSAEGDGSV